MPHWLNHLQWQLCHDRPAHNNFVLAAWVGRKTKVQAMWNNYGRWAYDIRNCVGTVELGRVCFQGRSGLIPLGLKLARDGLMKKPRGRVVMYYDGA